MKVTPPAAGLIANCANASCKHVDWAPPVADRAIDVRAARSGGCNLGRSIMVSLKRMRVLMLQSKSFRWGHDRGKGTSTDWEEAFG